MHKQATIQRVRPAGVPCVRFICIVWSNRLTAGASVAGLPAVSRAMCPKVVEGLNLELLDMMHCSCCIRSEHLPDLLPGRTREANEGKGAH